MWKVADPAVTIIDDATNPGMLDDQLNAVAQAAAAETADVWVMAPMVSTVAKTEDCSTVAMCTG